MTSTGWETDPMARLEGLKRAFGEFGGVNASVEVSTTFTVMRASTLEDMFEGKKGPRESHGGCFLYARSLSPSVEELARQLAAIEGTQAAYCTASGMAAIAATLLALCNAGDHVVASNAVYGGTFALLKSFLPKKCGIRVTFVDICDIRAVEAAFQPDTKVLYTETLSNPTLKVADLPALAQIAHARNCALVADNTFTPLILSPAKWGADVVIHSLTKFVSGASDVMAGVACGSDQFVASLMDLHTGPAMLLGPTLDAQTASLLSRRLPSLGIRMAEHSRRALAMANALQALGASVVYPGLPTNPCNARMVALMNPGYGCGGVVAVDMKTTSLATQLMERLQNVHRFGLMAVSLGYFDTLMSISGSSTSSELAVEERAAAGVSAGFLRLSIGYTGTLEQRVEQLREAYQAVMSDHGRCARASSVQGVREAASASNSPASSYDVHADLLGDAAELHAKRSAHALQDPAACKRVKILDSGGN